MAAGRKVFWTVGGKGLSPDSHYKRVSLPKINKGSVGRKPILATQTRINPDMWDRTLRSI